MADEDFDREMRDVDWAEVYDRQAARSVPVSRHCDILSVGSGDDILELGCGPGSTTEQLASRVTPGVVYALDRRPGALRYLVRRHNGRTGGETVRPVVEYHPDGPGDVGPSTKHRIAPAQVETWLSDAGFTLQQTTSLPEEMYALLSRR